MTAGTSRTAASGPAPAGGRPAATAAPVVVVRELRRGSCHVPEARSERAPAPAERR
jgi:hypothetical protein